MRMARKRNTQVMAYKLGTGGTMEDLLTREGKIICRGGKFFLQSLEGFEQADFGDFFKISCHDGEKFPYPNAREFFLANHRHLGGDLYEQLTKPLHVWLRGDSIDAPEMKFLLESGKLTLNPQDPAHYFEAELWGGLLTAAEDAALVFYDVRHNDTGAITDIDFNFVHSEIFQRDYTLL